MCYLIVFWRAAMIDACLLARLSHEWSVLDSFHMALWRVARHISHRMRCVYRSRELSSLSRLARINYASR